MAELVSDQVELTVTRVGVSAWLAQGGAAYVSGLRTIFRARRLPFTDASSRKVGAAA